MEQDSSTRAGAIASVRGPVRRVLAAMCDAQVRHLLMGGQACALYGVVEASADVDLLVAGDEGNLARLATALADLDAVVLDPPPLDAAVLAAGHLVRCRCAHADAADCHVDLMSTFRGADGFDHLWERRRAVTVDAMPGGTVDLLSRGDLVTSLKTQRGRDWLTIERLMKASYHRHRDAPTERRIRFWLRELRTPELLMDCVARFPDTAARMIASRRGISAALDGDWFDVDGALAVEEAEAREADRIHWTALRAATNELGA